MPDTLHTFAYKAATEALKPASGFVTSLVEPYRRRLESWIAGRELTRRVVSSRLAPMFDHYIKTLLPRVSRMRSVVFPSHSLPLAAIYEPLSARVRLDNGTIESYTAERLAREPLSRMIIEDAAGMGKSTFARAVALAVLQTESRLPIFVELGRMQGKKPIAEELLESLDPLGSVFDRELLMQLIMLGDFFIILDGLDEVPHEIRASVIAELASFSEKAGESVVLITSRPEGPIGGLGTLPVATFQPLNDIQVRQLLRRYDKYAGADVSSRLIPRLHSAPNAFLTNPLFVGLLYQVYGYTNEIAPKQHLFYASVYSALYKGQDLAKHATSRPKKSGLEIDAFRDFLGVFSYRSTLRAQFRWDDEADFVSDLREVTDVLPWVQATPSDFVEDLLLNVPMFYREGRSIAYLHRTLADYFCADFLAANPRSLELLRRIVDNASVAGHFRTVFGFIESINPRLFRDAILRPTAVAFHKAYMDVPEISDEAIRMLVANLLTLYDTTVFISDDWTDDTAVHRFREDLDWATEMNIAGRRVTLRSRFCRPFFMYELLDRFRLSREWRVLANVRTEGEEPLPKIDLTEGPVPFTDLTTYQMNCIAYAIYYHAQHIHPVDSLMLDYNAVVSFLADVEADERTWLERDELWGSALNPS